MCCLLIPPIPIGSEEPLRKKPTVTYALIGLEASLFLVDRFIRILSGFGVIPEDTPQRILAILAYIPGEKLPWTFITYAFLHGGWIHLLGNLLALWIFGCYLEQRLGKRMYLGLILLGSVFSCLGHDLVVNYFETTGTEMHNTPLLGASGYITAIMGAFVVLLPFNRVRCFYAYLIFLYFDSGKVVLPAFIYIPVFVFLDDLYSLTYYGAGTEVAHGAHLGGAAFGLLAGSLVRLASKGRDPSQEEEDELSTEEKEAKAALIHENIRKALAIRALEPALALIREAQKEGHPIKLKVQEKILLATLFEENGQTGQAVQSYRNLLAGELDFDQRLEIGLRLAKILLVVERDLEATKNLLRVLYREYKTDPRLPRIEEMIEQVKETERNLFKRPR